MTSATGVHEILLDGAWQAGLNRQYDRTLQVPGLATDPTAPTPGTLWYRRTVELPPGPWTDATLILKGARFAPEVYVDGHHVSSAGGGMAPTVHRFALPDPATARTVELEIALQSLDRLDPLDASATPQADLWRSNVSSCLWDSVLLRLHGDAEIGRLVPWYDAAADAVAVQWSIGGLPRAGDCLVLQILDPHLGRVARSEAHLTDQSHGRTTLDLRRSVHAWSPDMPHVYRLRAELHRNGSLVDATEQPFGVREFAVSGLGFALNARPFKLRMGTIVWHRWVCDPESAAIAFDADWFERNVVRRLKDLGANGLRFHLGLPPEKFLDLCDRHGLAVQLEWGFFHGIAASRESMYEQWRVWLDVAVRHPCVVTLQAWNETDGDQLDRARSALDPLLAEFPPMVVHHRDVIAVHKYWWSLFENLGLYYDSAAQFRQPVVADEFGGNYLDGRGEPGEYPETVGAFLRFLGRGNTVDERLELQTQSNARVAEYWRRVGIAGYSPFCILGSPKDGSHWFMGPLDVADPEPKPVWAALAASFAPRSVSLELWNRNFAPGETVTAPLWFFNDTAASAELTARITVDGGAEAAGIAPVLVRASVPPHGVVTQPVAIRMPAISGEWRVAATLENLTPVPTTPVVSAWTVRTLAPRVPAGLVNVVAGVADDEIELRALLDTVGVRVTSPDDPQATLIVGSAATWSRVRHDRETLERFDLTRRRGVAIVLIDAGPQPLGVGYTADPTGGPLEGVPTVAHPRVLEETELFPGIRLVFRETAEPESTLQPPESNSALWQGLARPATWLWNGLRGGLIVPAADMQVAGLGGEAMLTLWLPRGADAAAIRDGRCYAYALADHYAFADRPDDAATADRLRQRVLFLVEDAPALAGVVNPNADIVVTDLGRLYRDGGHDRVQSVTPLANAGKHLGRTPVVAFRFGAGVGSVVVSQLLTRGRLAWTEAATGDGVYALRYDPAACQVVLNLMAEAVS